MLVLPTVALAWGGGSSSSGSRVRKSSPPPKKTYTPPPVPAQPPEQRHVVSSVSYYVQFRSLDGWFPIEDPRVEERTWLCKVAYAPNVKKISDTKFEVLGNFKGKLEDQEETVPVVIKFILEGKDENWKVKKKSLHSVNGSEV